MDPEIRRLRSAWQLSRSPTGTLLKMELVRSLPDAVGVSADEVSTPTPDRVFETVGCQKPTALGTSWASADSLSGLPVSELDAPAFRINCAVEVIVRGSLLVVGTDETPPFAVIQPISSLDKSRAATLKPSRTSARTGRPVERKVDFSH